MAQGLPHRRGRLAGVALAATLATLAAVVLAAVPGPPASGQGPADPASPGAWTTYGASFSRRSAAAGGPSLRHLRHRWTSPRIAGAIYGQPLLAEGLVLVATEADEVVALHASSGRIAWRRRLGSPVPASALPCGDIAPSVGVTSTMVLDAPTGRLFASAATVSGGRIRHVLVALQARTGRVLWRRNLDRPHWDPAAQLQRAALAISNGRVIVGFGGNYGDCGRYHGYLMAVPESGHGPVLHYEVPTAREGAIWAPSGVSVAPDGTIYAATGNGSSTTTYDSGDSVLRLSPTLERRGSFAPANWAEDNAGDADLGSTAPMILPGGRLLAAGKETTAYLLDARRLGGIGHPLAATPACFSIGGDAYVAPFAYLACPKAALTAIRVGSGSLSIAWRAPPGVDGSPTIAGGLLWSLGRGRIFGLSPATGRVLTATAVVPTEAYAAPAAADGLLVVGGTHAVEAFEGSAGYRP